MRKRAGIELVIVLVLVVMALSVRLYRLQEIPFGLNYDEAANGMDVLNIPSLHLRASVNATYRILHSKFGTESEDYYNLLECARNTDPTLKLEDGIYNLDLDGVQLGIMFTFVP